MKLINEAALDDKFNIEMAKIQDAIEKLEKIAVGYGGDISPVKSQRVALSNAIVDLTKIQTTMFNE
jgi:hypothetical protein